MLLLLHSTFIFSVVKMLLKGDVGGREINSHGNTLLIMENHGIVFLNFFGNPANSLRVHSVCCHDQK